MAQPKSEGLSAKAMVLIGTLAGSVATGLVTFFVQSYSDRASLRDESQIAEVRSFIEAGEEYKKLAPTFMRNLTQGRETDQDEKALLENLDEQNTRLQTAMSNLEHERYEAAAEYQVKLGRAGRFLASTNGISGSEPLVQELMDILNEEVCITFYLRDEAGLAVSDDVMLKCPHY